MGLLSVPGLAGDPRADPGAYITDGRQLYEVVGARNNLLLIQDCRSTSRTSISGVLLRRRFRLVSPAPVVPDFITEEEST